MACITFAADGTGSALYTEAVDLTALGAVSITRATTIEFDNAAGCWTVRDNTGFAVFNNPSRQVCLDWEQQYLQSQEDRRHEL